METVVKKLYEAMFLVDSAQAAADWDAVIATIKNVLERAEAEIVSIRKWDERKLAYAINGKTRGTYILCYFRADGGRIREIERDVQLSEQIMRVLILSAEAREKEDIEKDTPAMQAEKRKQKIAQEATERIEAERASAREEAIEAEKSQQSSGEPKRNKGRLGTPEPEAAEEAEAEEVSEDREQRTEDRKQKTDSDF